MRICLVSVVACGILTGCVEQPVQPELPDVYQPPPEQITEVVAYPARGQSAGQLDRDRYECHLWAVRQTGFDPSIPGVPPHQRVRIVQGPPAGAAVAGGAVTGAVLGAVVSGPHDAGEGALIGAAAGAVIGAITESSRAEATRRVDATEQQRQAQESAGEEQKADDYRRAITACLTGRGYSVR